jgi:hypothetical protein
MSKISATGLNYCVLSVTRNNTLPITSFGQVPCTLTILSCNQIGGQNAFSLATNSTTNVTSIVPSSACKGGFILEFQAPTDAANGSYGYAGIYCTNVVVVPGAFANTTFPVVVIARNSPPNVVISPTVSFTPDANSMVIYDLNSNTNVYSFSLLIQDLGSGLVGIFDPDTPNNGED